MPSSLDAIDAALRAGQAKRAGAEAGTDSVEDSLEKPGIAGEGEQASSQPGASLLSLDASSCLESSIQLAKHAMNAAEEAWSKSHESDIDTDPLDDVTRALAGCAADSVMSAIAKF